MRKKPRGDSDYIPEFNEQGRRQIGFEANDLRYDQDTDTVTASGNVILRSGDQSLRADDVSWNRTTGEIIASGNIRLVDADGNQLFTDSMTLTDELEAGAMSNLLLAFRSGRSACRRTGYARREWRYRADPCCLHRLPGGR